MEYYSAIKRNTFESAVMGWINLEPSMQSKVSQKEKNKYYILTHTHGIQKNGTDEPRRAWTCGHSGGGEGGTGWGSVLTHAHYRV